MVVATPEDMTAANKLVTISPGYLSKWTKAELTSAALALKLFIQELPGGPKLLNRAASLATSSHGGEEERMFRAVRAIRCQEGLDASLYRPTQDVEDEAATSTQAPGATRALGGLDASLIPNPGGGGGDGSLSWVDMSNQIPPGQRGTSSFSGGGNGGGNDDRGGNSDDGNPMGKVSDHSSASDPSLAAPIQLPNGPHNGAVVGVVGDGIVDAGTGGVGVTWAGGAGAASAGVRAAADASAVSDGRDEQGGELPPPQRQQQQHQQNTKKKGVCSYSWRRKPCAKSHGCQHQHPTLCYNPACADGRIRGCNKFHGSQAARMKEEGRHNRTGKSQGNGRRGDRRSPNNNNGHNNKRSSSRNYNNSTADKSMVELCKARERVAKLQLQLSKTRAQQSTAPPPPNGSTGRLTWAGVASGNSRHIHTPAPAPTSVHVQPSHDLAEIVARAVKAALRGALL